MSKSVACPDCIFGGGGCRYYYYESTTKCHNCDKEWHATEHKYCLDCAQILNKCNGCGNDFKPCRDYIHNYKKYTESQIASYKKISKMCSW